jgi:medium-chain acyl-[acyl-carrier-protein] hydrolase
MSAPELLKELRKLDATPIEMLERSDIVDLIIPLLRADAELCETYEYVAGVPLSCPVVAFAGTQDRDETVEKMRPWRTETTGSFSLYPLEGDHFFIDTKQQQVLSTLGRLLLRARALTVGSPKGVSNEVRQ